MDRLTYKELLAIPVLLLLSTVTFGQSAPPQEVGSLLQQGAVAMRAGNAAEAEASYKKATETAPNFAPGWLDLGLAQLKEGKLEDATGSIRHALTLDSSVHGARLFLGIAEYQTQHIDAAVADLEQAGHEDPDNVQVLMWLGIVEMESGHPEKATAPLDRAAELAPNDVGILDYRVQAHMAVARQSYTRLYRLDPGSWRLHRLNAQIDAQAGQPDGAIQEYQAAIKIAPKQADLYEGLGWEYRQTGHLDLAEKAFEQQLELTPGNPIAMYNLASTRVDAGQAASAVGLLEQVVKLNAAPNVADYYLGRAYAAEGKPEPAVAEYQKATTLGGETARQAWYGLGQVYRELGSTAEARAAVEKFQQLHQQAAQARAKDIQDWRKLNAGAESKPLAAQPAQ
ncbi:MAG TPA: tetratricopeptide repeat protein [Acidobacteriaceae bacterium]|jgi:tetratricopeptide (TPR) repeat protein|nr:tetratricopeptide repeat protein [Acidobacteriaceae bacterium]